MGSDSTISDRAKKKQQVRVKVVLAGQPGVGKTSLTRRFISNEFSEHHIETIGVRVEKRTVELDHHSVELVIWDVAGVEDSAPFHNTYLRGAAGVIYVADRTDTASVERLKRLGPAIESVAPDHLRIAVLNKSDLPGLDSAEVAFKALPVANKLSTSALTGDGVEGVFTDMAAYAVDRLV